MLTYRGQCKPRRVLFITDIHSVSIGPCVARLRLQYIDSFMQLLQLVIRVRIQVKHAQKEYTPS
jgi:hypothetical protein